MVALLEEAGAIALALPTIRIEPPGDTAPLTAAIAAIDRYDWVIFTSMNAVEAFMKRFLEDRPDANLNAFARVAAVGKSTTDALAEYSVTVDFQPEKFTAEVLAERLTACETLLNKKILLPRSDIAPRTIVELLRSNGAETDELIAYRTVPEEMHRGEYNRLFEGEAVDMITFTSSSTVENLVPLLSEKALAFFRQKLASASIGPMTSRTLREYGVTPAVEPAEHTVEGMVEAIAGYYGRH